MSFENILYAKQDHVAIITLNRADNLNAFHDGMLGEWSAAIEDAKRDGDIRVVIITGAGRGFCSGMDVKSALKDGSTGGMTPIAQRRTPLRYSVHQVPLALRNLEKPYIAAINGAAVGAGMDMASMADIRIASAQARFGMTYVKMGLAPGDGGCYYLPRIVGMQRALELIWTGRIFDAEEALAIGYVLKVVPHERLMDATLELSAQIAENAPIGVQLAKKLAYQAELLDVTRALDLSETALSICRSTEDSLEGPMAFVEKRKPQFKGR
ncbi:MAG: enoyl-CoA hydratase [Chloroflexota bacterium]|nr:MAG: enoyl-CoA hydratase [Chloroflexota bacterium]